MEGWYPIDETSEVLMTTTVMDNAASPNEIVNTRKFPILDGAEAMLYGEADGITKITTNFRYSLEKTSGFHSETFCTEGQNLELFQLRVSSAEI